MEAELVVRRNHEAAWDVVLKFSLIIHFGLIDLLSYGANLNEHRLERAVIHVEVITLHCGALLDLADIAVEHGVQISICETPG